MVDKSPGVFEVAFDYVEGNAKWAAIHPLYSWYFFLFVGFGTAGIWIEYAWPPDGMDRAGFLQIFKFIPLITFSAPIIVAILAKHILIGFAETHNEYPMKTLRTFCLIYFLFVILLFVIGYSTVGGMSSVFCGFAVLLLLTFQFFYGAKDKDYEDISLDISARSSEANKDNLSGGGYE